MQEIKLNNKVIGYVEESKDVLKYLPNGSPDGFKMLGGKTDRELLYGKDLYVITKSDKVIGIEIGNVCTICGVGTLNNQSNCAVCSACGAGIKCNL